MIQQRHATATVEPMGRETEYLCDVIAALANERTSSHIATFAQTFAYGERAGTHIPDV